MCPPQSSCLAHTLGPSRSWIEPWDGALFWPAGFVSMLRVPTGIEVRPLMAFWGRVTLVWGLSSWHSQHSVLVIFNAIFESHTASYLDVFPLCGFCVLVAMNLRKPVFMIRPAPPNCSSVSCILLFSLLPRYWRIGLFLHYSKINASQTPPLTT